MRTGTLCGAEQRFYGHLGPVTTTHILRIQLNRRFCYLPVGFDTCSSTKEIRVQTL